MDQSTERAVESWVSINVKLPAMPEVGGLLAVIVVTFSVNVTAKTLPSSMLSVSVPVEDDGAVFVSE